jgi:uncharacterized protein YbjQ (UPF0145 family)
MAKRDKKNIEFLSTQSYPGREVEAVGLVVEIHTVGLGTFRDYIARIMDILGGRVNTYDKPARKAMEKVFDSLQDQASALGADAVIGVAVEVSPVPFKGMAMTQVVGFGTAVRFLRKEVNEFEGRDGVLPLSEESKRVVSEMTARSGRAVARPTIPILKS